MFAALPALWAGFTGWLTKNPVVIWIGGILLVIIGWEKVKADIRSAAKKAERQAQAEREAKTRTEMVTRTTEIVTEERSNADEALQARDHSDAPASFDELPIEHQELARGRAVPRGTGGR